MKEMTYKTRI